MAASRWCRAGTGGTCASLRGAMSGNSAVIPHPAHGLVTPQLLPGILAPCITTTTKSVEAGNLGLPHKIRRLPNLACPPSRATRLRWLRRPAQDVPQGDYFDNTR